MAVEYDVVLMSSSGLSTGIWLTAVEKGECWTKWPFGLIQQDSANAFIMYSEIRDIYFCHLIRGDYLILEKQITYYYYFLKKDF